MGEGRRKRRRRVEPTDDWKQLKLLFGWPEQVRYEELRPLVLFGPSVAERAIEIEAAERTLYRRMDRFETEGMESLFDSETASLAAGPFHLHGGHLATHATDFLSSLVHEGVADFMSRSAHSFPLPIYSAPGGLRQAPGRAA